MLAVGEDYVFHSVRAARFTEQCSVKVTSLARLGSELFLCLPLFLILPPLLLGSLKALSHFCV